MLSALVLWLGLCVGEVPSFSTVEEPSQQIVLNETFSPSDSPAPLELEDELGPIETPCSLQPKAISDLATSHPSLTLQRNTFLRYFSLPPPSFHS